MSDALFLLATAGPHWYPLALVVTAMPCAWAGGQLRVLQAREARR